MSITTIIMFIIGVGGAILGAMIGHPFSKASGKSEGAAQAVEKQEVVQAQATVQAVKDRSSVEAQVATDSDAALDQRLSKYDRPD
jgi:hypothetical protein